MDRCPFFNCQRCRALYHVVEVAGGPKIVTPRRRIVERKERCRLCGEPLPQQAIRAEILPASDASGDEGEAPLRPCLKSSYAAANSTGSIKVGSSASAFELLTRFDTGQRCR